jgi:hypothetical protein
MGDGSANARSSIRLSKVRAIELRVPGAVLSCPDSTESLVAKVWNFAHVLRDQGVSYQAYISQISYLLFLKMDEERETQIGEPSMLPAGSRWEDIKELAGEALAVKYGRMLETLSRQSGVIGAILIPTSCRRRMRSRPKSSRAWRRRSRASGPWRRSCKGRDPHPWPLSRKGEGRRSSPSIFALSQNA